MTVIVTNVEQKVILICDSVQSKLRLDFWEGKGLAVKTIKLGERTLDCALLIGSLSVYLTWVVVGR